MLTNRPNAIIDQKTGKIITQLPLPPILYLVFKGGGVRGLAYAGFAKVFKRYGLMDQVERCAGSSAGAIAALIMALDYSVEEITQLLQNMNLEAFLDEPLSSSNITKIQKLWTMLTGDQVYLSDGKKFLDWLEDIVEKKLGKRDATFKDLADYIEKNKDKNGKCKFKYLYITATNISLLIPQCEVFSHETQPDMPIALAVRMSASVPFVFKQLTWKGQQYSDGGILENLPCWIFDERRFLPKGYEFTDYGTNPATLAITTDSREEKNYMMSGISVKKQVQYFSHLLKAMYNTFSQVVKTRDVRSHLTISLFDGNITMMEQNISSIKKESLILSAEKETQSAVENLAGAAASVKLFDSIMSWLESLTLGEINYIISIYQKMEELISTSNNEEEHKNSRHDPNHPSKEELCEKIKFMNSYFQYRIALMHDENLKFDVPYPKNYINIKPYIEQSDWGCKVIREMTERLEDIEVQIKIAKKCLDTYFDDHYHNIENIKQRAGQLEYLKSLYYKRDELELKLNLPHTKDPWSDQLRKIDSKQFEQFCLIVEPHLVNNAILSVNAIILNEIELHRPKFIFRSCHESDNVTFGINLRYVDDRKCFILAASLFFKLRDYKQPAWLRELFKLHFDPKLKIRNSTTIDELSVILNLSGIDLYIAAFRIEELVHHFEKKQCPSKTPLFSKFISKKALLNETEEFGDEMVALKNIYPKPQMYLSKQVLFKSKNDVVVNKKLWSDKVMFNDDRYIPDPPPWFLGK